MFYYTKTNQLEFTKNDTTIQLIFLLLILSSFIQVKSKLNL